MAIYSTVFVLIVVCTAVRAQPPRANATAPVVVRSSGKSGCPEGWNSANNKCYALSDEKLDWYEAVQVCLTYESQLFEDEHADTTNYLKSLMVPKEIDAVWIGGSSNYKEGKWFWIPSMKPISYTNWGSNEPNNPSSERCLEVRADNNYKWNDRQCFFQRQFVCERNMTPQ